MRKLFLLLALMVAAMANAQFMQGFRQGLQQGVRNTRQQVRQNNASALKTLRVENGFTWYMTMQNDSYGAEDQNHKTLIPLSRKYAMVIFMEVENHVGYFEVWKGDDKGVCDLAGREIIPPIHHFVTYDEDGFKSQSSSGDYKALGWYLDENGMATQTNTNKVNAPEPKPKKSYREMSIGELRAKAEQGDAKAQVVLGANYAEGNGVSQSNTEAVKWFRKSAEQGLAEAQFALGGCYLEGKGISKNETEAAKWFRKSAEQGFAAAQLYLGMCYWGGLGVVPDKAEARKWLQKAADQGNERAYGFLLGLDAAE